MDQLASLVVTGDDLQAMKSLAAAFEQYATGSEWGGASNDWLTTEWLPWLKETMVMRSLYWY